MMQPSSGRAGLFHCQKGSICESCEDVMLHCIALLRLLVCIIYDITESVRSFRVHTASACDGAVVIFCKAPCTFARRNRLKPNGSSCAS